MLPKAIQGSATGSLHDHSGVKVDWKCAVANIPIDFYSPWRLDLSTTDPPLLYSEESVDCRCDWIPGLPACVWLLSLSCPQRPKQLSYQSDCPLTGHLSDILGTPSVTRFCHNNVWMWVCVCVCVASVCLALNLCCLRLVSLLFLNVSSLNKPSSRWTENELTATLIIDFEQAAECRLRAGVCYCIWDGIRLNIHTAMTNYTFTWPQQNYTLVKVVWRYKAVLLYLHKAQT